MSSSFSSSNSRRAIIFPSTYNNTDKQFFAEFKLYTDPVRMGNYLEVWSFKNEKIFVMTSLSVTDSGNQFLSVSYNSSGNSYRKSKSCNFNMNTQYRLQLRIQQLISTITIQSDLFDTQYMNKSICTINYTPDRFSSIMTNNVLVLSQSNYAYVMDSRRFLTTMAVSNMTILFSRYGVECGSSSCESSLPSTNTGYQDSNSQTRTLLAFIIPIITLVLTGLVVVVAIIVMYLIIRRRNKIHNVKLIETESTGFEMEEHRK
ncbi:TATA-box-binding protein [Acrasis kona]|uniref:TATA-box-binding protein n=1 Tax=Acrasis kona TaxID=1008807 RepID=A0AAW2ZG24_9EUKA